MAGRKKYGWRKDRDNKDGFIYSFQREGLSIIYRPTARYRKGVFSLSIVERLEEPDIHQLQKDVWWDFREHGKRLVVVNSLNKRKGLTPTQVEIYWYERELPSLETVTELYEKLKKVVYLGC